MLCLPLGLAALGLIASIIMIYVVKTQAGKAPAAALRTGTLGAPVLFLAAGLVLVLALGVDINVWFAVVAGAVGGVAIGLITEYYTAGPPVTRIAASGETGPATVMITGLAVGMQSVVLPMLFQSGERVFARTEAYSPNSDTELAHTSVAFICLPVALEYCVAVLNEPAEQ